MVSGSFNDAVHGTYLVRSMKLRVSEASELQDTATRRETARDMEVGDEVVVNRKTTRKSATMFAAATGNSHASAFGFGG